MPSLQKRRGINRTYWDACEEKDQNGDILDILDILEEEEKEAIE